MSERLLEMRGLRTCFRTDEGLVTAVDGISLCINKGEILGVVGESGCGKSVMSLSIMRLIADPPGKIVDGEILFEGDDILRKSEAEMRKMRGKDISMIFQEPMTSLNPIFTVGDQIKEAIMAHEKVSDREARKKGIEMLKLVGIPSPEHRFDDYPHQMSGGMRQRVMIAMALSCNPKLLIADEPTTALDVTIQAQILELMLKLNEELGTAIMLITHDLGVIAETVERVIVMYAGKIVESADVRSIFASPQHPYTVGLLGSVPRLDQECERLNVIEGMVPSPLAFPRGCRFNPRCSYAEDICREMEPQLVAMDDGHQVSCWRFLDYRSTQK